MKTSTVVILGLAIAGGIGAVLWYTKQKSAAGTPVAELTPGGTYQMVVPLLPGMDPATMLATAGPLGWTNVTQLTAATSSVGLQTAAKANGIDLSAPNELIWQGTYNGAAAAPIAAGAAAVRMS
jgi:hypothetical protein